MQALKYWNNSTPTQEFMGACSTGPGVFIFLYREKALDHAPPDALWGALQECSTIKRGSFLMMICYNWCFLHVNNLNNVQIACIIYSNCKWLHEYFFLNLFSLYISSQFDQLALESYLKLSQKAGSSKHNIQENVVQYITSQLQLYSSIKLSF